MKQTKKLKVSVTYVVEVSNMQVPENVLDQLNEIYDQGGELTDADRKFHDAYYWIGESFKEQDAYDWSYNIDEIES